MKKQITQFLLVFISVFMLSLVNAQAIVTTSDESSKGKCDGSAMISSMALPNLTSWVWKKDTTIIQKDGKDLVNLCGGKYIIQYVDKQNKTHIDSFFVNTKSSGGGTNACDGFKVFPSFVRPNVKDSSGKCSGRIELSIAGGHKPFVYTWTTMSTNKTNSADALCGGNYGGYVKDSMGCTAQFNVAIKDTSFNNGGGTGGGTKACDGFKVFPSYVRPNVKDSSGKCTGRIELSVAGGHKPFMFTWTTNAPNQTNSAEGLCGGNYGGYVKDSMGCTAQFNVAIKDTSFNNGGGNNGGGSNGKPCQVELKGKSTDSTGLNFYLTFQTRVDNNGTVKSYELKIDGKVVSTDSIFIAKMTPGKHTFEYAITTSIGCEDRHIDTMSFPYFDEPKTDCKNSNLKVALVKIENNKQGSTNCIGLIQVKAIGGKSPYHFQWNNNISGEFAKGLCPGKYDVHLKDSNNCSVMASFEIKNDSVVGSNPCKEFKLELTKAINDKYGDSICTGLIDVHTVGGTAPFYFKWNNGVNTPYNEKLCAGKYTLNVKDANNCYASFTQSIYQDSVIVANPCQGFKVEIAKIQNTRKGETVCTGLIETRTYGGTTPYTYKWSNGGSTNMMDKLCEGKYTLLVRDKNNCGFELTALVKADSIINPTTTSNCAGFIINVNGIKNAVKGANNCTGAIMTNVSGGKQPYTFYWSNGTKDLFLSNVCAGTYTLKALDANGCLVSITKDVKADTASVNNDCTTLTANVLVKNTNASANACNGALEISVNGGTAPYAFVWNTSATGKAINGLCEGNYSVTITDAKKCAIKVNKYVGRDSIVQNPCAGFFANVNVKNDQDGDNVCSGVLLVNAGGGKSPYNYKWSDGSTQPYLKDVCKGSYAVSVFDANNCSLTIEKYVGLDSVFNPCKNFYAKIASVENCGLNATKCNGGLKVVVAGGKAPYDFTWSNGVKAPSISDLCPNEYSVEVKDANKCAIVLTGKVSIDSTKNVCDGFFTKVVEVKNDKAGDNKCSGAIFTSTLGGKAPYAYLWSNGAKTANIIDVCSDKYFLYVKDANNCINQVDKFVGSDSIVDVCKGFNGYISSVKDYSADDSTCLGGLEATIKGGKAPFNYSWSNGDSTLTASNLCEGGYSLTIVDANECNITLNGKVRMLPSKKQKLKAYVTSTDVTAAGACDGTVNVKVVSGNAPYYFYHSNGEISDSRTGVCAGVYSVIVKDAKNEVVELSYLISSPLNTIINEEVEVPVGSDTTVVDTVSTSVTKECSIDYNAIDSVQIVEYKMIAKDSLLVTWAIYSASNVTYVTDMYVFTAGTGVYAINLELYCDEKKAIGNFLKASESFYYLAEGTTAIVEKVTENVNVYPNPFSDKFTVKLEKVQDYQIHVMDMSGKALYTNSFANTNAINLDLGHLASGQYILKIVSETSSFSRMISK